MSKWQTRSQRKWSRTLHLLCLQQGRPYVEPRPGEVRWISELDAVQQNFWTLLRHHPRQPCWLARRWTWTPPSREAMRAAIREVYGGAPLSNAVLAKPWGKP